MTLAVMAAPRCAVTLVDILDNFFTLVAAGQVEIDVGPLAALFGKKTFEEQFHADGIDCGDAERVADGAVGGGSASLHQDVLLTAVADQVPDDEEVAGEFEFFDEGKFFLDLAAGAGLQVLRGAAVAVAESFPRALAQERVHGLAFGHGIAREFVAEIVEREFQARGKFERVGDGFGQIGEELLHFLRGFQKAFGVAGRAGVRQWIACGGGGWQ